MDDTLSKSGNAFMWDGLIVIARVAVLVYVGLLIFLAGCQRQMIYYPVRSTEANARQWAATDGLVPWRSDTGELIGWRPDEIDASRDVMLAFHGNAGFAAQRGYLVHPLAPAFDVYLMEYPGYGTRAGRPSEAAFVAAAQEAVDLLLRKREGRVFLLGESLGGGVAAAVAGSRPNDIAGLLLLTPFDSLVNVARYHYPVFPVRLLLRDRFENAKHLESFSGPVAIVVAEEDEVVPARFGRALYDAYAGPKRIWVQEGRSHNTLDLSIGNPMWSEMMAFLQAPPES